MSSESLKFIVENLNAPPFNCNTSLIALDLWPPTALLQQLSDVISWITQTNNIDVTREPAEETALRLLNNLRILRFRPPSGIEQLEEWRAGLVEGAKKSIYPVLLYLFSNVDMLKQRAYLAKYLIQDEIPSNVLDNDVTQLRNELSQHMERFKEIHANVLDVQQDTMLIDDIKSDLKSMEVEKEWLTRKIEKTYKKIQNFASLDRQLAAANQLGLQKERLEEMDRQRSEQRDGVIHAEKRVQRCKDQLAELRQAYENIDPSNMIAVLRDEIATNTFLLETKLAKEIEQKRQVVSELATASNTPAVSSSDLSALQTEVNKKTDHIMELEQERDKGEEQISENFSIFRHQAANVERRKNTLAQKLQDARKELSDLEQQVEQKKQVLRSTSGSEVMSAHQFKAYVIRVRDKKVVYKKKKAQIEEILTEREVLLRTIDLLAKKFENIKEKIENMNGKPVESIAQRRTARPQTAAPASTDVKELSSLVMELTRSAESALVRNKQNDYERRRMQMEKTYEDQKTAVESMKHDETETTEAIASLERQLAEAESQLSSMDSANPADGKTRLKEKLDIKRQQIEQMRQQHGNNVDLNGARQRMAMWRGLLLMFEAKTSTTSEKEKLM
ncbi:hypothetical protein Q1695_000132 [Nippostrongylus brasiliensis]|nr:hypothetical protein Q1695_000132 [Nippostrongylus brasiliensis]